MQTSDLNVNNTESDHANAIFHQFQDAIFSYVKTLTKMIFDLLQWQEIATLSLLLQRFLYLNNISRAFSPRSQWHYTKSITCHFCRACVEIFPRWKWNRGVGTWIIERVDRKLMSRGLISYRRLVVSCSKMALDGSIIVEIGDETMAQMWRKPVEM